MLTSLCLSTYNRTDHLIKVLQAIAQHARPPYEVIVVDDCSSNKEVHAVLDHFQRMFTTQLGVDFVVYIKDKNEGHAPTNNIGWKLAKGDVIIHIEDDIVMPHDGWNLAMGAFLMAHPEVGQVAPEGSGRGEWIPRESPTGGYREFAWALGGLFAIRREVYQKVGGWDEHLAHQIEPDYNLRVRMAGWRLAELPGLRMVHLGEGEYSDSFKRQSQIVIGVHQMLGKWNRRFMGAWDYDNLFAMSWDDFPPNVAFRRQLAAWFAAQAEKLKDRYRGLGVLKDDPHYSDAVPAEVRQAYNEFSKCEINSAPEPFQYPSHWGRYELVKVIRPCGRERERELITLMKNNYVFGYVRRVENQLRDLAKRMNYDLSEEELQRLSNKVPIDVRWEAIPVYPA